MKKKLLMLALLFGCFLFPQKAFAAENDTARHYDLEQDGGTFEPDETGTYHYILDGQMVKNGFLFDGTYTYYLQNDGTPMKDRLTYHPDGEHIIYFDEYGHEAFDREVWVKTSMTGENLTNTQCYFGTFGYMFKDQIAFDGCGEPECYNACGAKERNGWFQFADGNFGYAQGNGILMHNEFGYNPCGQKVFYHWNGVMAKGLIADDNYYYQMDEKDGHLIGAFQKDPNAQLTQPPADGATIRLREGYDFNILGENPITKNFPNHNFLTYMGSKYSPKDDWTLWIYQKSDGSVSNSETHGNELFLTNRGIMIGSTKADVVAAYGQTNDVVNGGDISGTCQNGTLENRNGSWVSPEFGRLPQKEPEAYACLNRAKTYANYGLSLTTDDDFLFMRTGTYLRTGIRFYYDENDRVIMIQYYEEHSANGV